MYFNKNDTIIWSYTFFLIRKKYCSCEIAATHAGFGHIQVGIATKIFVLILHVTVVSWTRAWNRFRPWEMHILYNPDGIVKYSVIHRLWLINSAQLCNKKFQSICWSRNAALFIMCLQAMLILVILEISSVSLNSEAYHVSFLNQTLKLQIEKYMKNGQPSFQCNV